MSSDIARIEPFPPQNRVQDSHVREIKALYRKAEEKIKALERESETLASPSVNELRYAGYHLLAALTETDSEKKIVEFDKARGHCKRAIYDAQEVRVMAKLVIINQFKEDYAKISISDVVSDYIVFLQRVRRIQKAIENINSDSREDYYNEIESHFSELDEIGNALETSREELNKKLEARRIAFLQWFAVIVISAVGAVAAVLTLL